MGLGVAYGIYILGRIKGKQTTSDAMQQSLLTSGKAVLFAALSVSLSVLVWVFSPVKMEAKMGICLALLFCVNMLSAIILLPALWCSRKNTYHNRTA
jgi:hypothetical protein